MRKIRFILLALAQVALSLQAPAVKSQSPEQAAVIQTIRTGRDAMQRGNLQEAEVQFRKATAAAPSFSDAYLGLGLVQLRRGEIDDAIQALSRATELNPKLPGAHLFLGIAEYQVGQPESAATALKAEIALRPGNTEALTWLGVVELGAGHPEQATAPLDEAAALNPKDPQTLYYRARAHMLVAEAAYRELSQLDPDSALVHRGMAESFEVAGQPEKAIAEYEAAIKKDASNPDLYDALADANQKISRIDAARQAYQKELELNPHSALALYNLGRMDVERGQPADGVALLHKAQAAHASPAPTSFYLGLGLAELGQNAEAAHWLEDSLANHPSPFIEQGAWYQLGRVYQKLNRKTDSQHALAELKRLLDLAQQQKEVTAKQAAAGAAVAPDAPPTPKQP